MGNDYFVGIDLGGTSMRVAMGVAAGDILAHDKAPTMPEQGPAAVFERLAQLVEQTRATAGLPAVPAVAWGVAFPGPVKQATGVLTTPPNLPGWHNVPVRDLLAPYARTKVMVANDAHVAALGEHGFGAGKGCRDMIYMTISTGIGGGIVANDRLQLGADGAAGEVGHIVLDWRGPLCNCGNRGCLEALASGTAIGRDATSSLEAGEQSILRAGSLPLTAKQVIDAAHAGDSLASGIIKQAARIIGAGCVSLVNLLNPQMIVLGGGVALHASDLLLGPIRETIDTHAMELPRKTVRVALCKLGDEAGLYGSLALARNIVAL